MRLLVLQQLGHTQELEQTEEVWMICIRQPQEHERTTLKVAAFAGYKLNWLITPVIQTQSSGVLLINPLYPSTTYLPNKDATMMQPLFVAQR